MAVPPSDIVPGSETVESLSQKMEAWCRAVGADLNRTHTELSFGVFKGHLNPSGSVDIPHRLPGVPSGAIASPSYPPYLVNILTAVGDRWGGGVDTVRFTCYELTISPLAYGSMGNEYVEFNWLAFTLRK